MALGVPPEMLAAMLRDSVPKDPIEDADDLIEVLPGNVDAVRLFFALGTQWRTVAFSVGPVAMIFKTALDYAAMPAAAAAIGVTVDSAMLEQLQILEAEAALAMAESRR